MSTKPKPDYEPPPLKDGTSEERMERLGRMLDDALAVSNVTVRKKLEAEQRARAKTRARTKARKKR